MKKSDLTLHKPKQIMTEMDTLVAPPSWRSLITSKDGPKSPRTRLVLMVLGQYMNGMGQITIPPTLGDLAEGAGLSRMAAVKSLHLAMAEGWVDDNYNPMIPERFL